jgi:DNA repair exonuclease SbcCD ATPase subunit
MFGRPHEIDDTTDALDTAALDRFFGDETATANAAELVELHQRIELVESQITSQFTSLATYAQIAQEQVEIARAEAKASTERSEQRLTSLIERERADRVAVTGAATAGDVTARLDALEQSVAEIRASLAECLERQKALAEAITTVFDRLTPAPTTTPVAAQSSLPAPTVEPAAAPAPVAAAVSFAPPTVTTIVTPPLADGPIAGLSLAG